ncbi:ribonuclease catalytic domain-containing protein [Spirochaeta isovalerica]|uniref:Exoribonuclease-2 n=1 Tax=Spirochaeta isovalerica TaxID=150 RepID=A0A841R6M3_9SPIO|nr:RNB domain-containing ribonuclease [Spirochaeta isovalerica]MBB6478837.1 exoribonuclease-2 [Spirochaeta isovalerica]
MEKGNLVLYKHNPAIVTAVADKIDIVLKGGKTKKVREKDIQLLHKGPTGNFEELKETEGQIEEGWELLIGEKPDLEELSSLIFGQYTPSTAWQAYLLLNRTIYFKGTVEEIIVCTPEEVEQASLAKKAKEEEQAQWQAFMERLKSRTTLPEDKTFFIDLENMAYKKSRNSRILTELGRAKTPENAHKTLLELGIWDYSINPWPNRYELSLKSSSAELSFFEDDERVDLTHLESFAIDDEGNTDPDDAISIDGDRIWIHIADAALLAPPDSDADLEASRRGANLYIPETTVSMLPPEATEKLGLGLHEISPAFSFGLTFDPEMNVDDITLVLSNVKVTRLTYSQADKMLDKGPLKDIYEVTSRYREKRISNGAVELSLPEAKIRADENNRVEIRPIPELESRKMVTDAMLMAGNAAALFAIRNEIPVPFATQPKPDFDKKPEPDPASQFASRKFMKRSRMSTVPEGHGGLGLDFYARATSPLRRYPDLIVLQQLRNHITGKPILNEDQVIERVALFESVSGTVVSAERKSNLHWKLVYLLQNPEWKGSAVYVGKKEKQAVFLIPDLAMEVLMPVKKDLPLNGTIEITPDLIDLANQEVIFKEIVEN